MLNRVVLALIMVLIFPLLFVSASDPGTTDWPMWGGTPDRNMVSNAKGLPASWDTATKKNVKWVAALGSQTYGNPVVAGGMVFVGTNNEGLRNPKRRLQHDTQHPDPEADLSLAHPKNSTHSRLNGVDLIIEEDEEQFIGNMWEFWLATTRVDVVFLDIVVPSR